MIINQAFNNSVHYEIFRHGNISQITIVNDYSLNITRTSFEPLIQAKRDGFFFVAKKISLVTKRNERLS